MDSLSFYQMQIINILLFKQSARFRELNLTHIPTDHLNYHIKTLLNEGFVEKKADQQYCLTEKGKRYAERLDTFNAKIEEQPSSIVSAIVTKQDKDKLLYLIHQRKKHPFYDHIGFPGGKIKREEFPSEAAMRELIEETGITGDHTKLRVVKQIQKKDARTKKLFSSYSIYYFTVRYQAGEIKDMIEGTNFWMSEDDIRNAPLRLEHDFSILPLLTEPGIQYVEETLEYTMI